jgi:Ni/Co efflux regulator RcnB
MKRNIFYYLFTILLMVSANSVYAQKDKGQTPKQAAKEQGKLKSDREKKIEAEIKAKKKGHVDSQDKQTRKRMKRNLKKTERLKTGKTQPFYKRWFRKKRVK